MRSRLRWRTIRAIEPSTVGFQQHSDECSFHKSIFAQKGANGTSSRSMQEYTYFSPLKLLSRCLIVANVQSAGIFVHGGTPMKLLSALIGIDVVIVDRGFASVVSDNRCPRRTRLKHPLNCECFVQKC